MSAPIHRHREMPVAPSDAAAEPFRIAVFQALNLGDLLCATPALRAIRRCFPDAEITLIGRPWARELGERLSTVDRFIPFPGFPGIAESPTGVPAPLPAWPRFDLAIQMHGSGEVSNGFVASLGAARSAGLGPPGDRRLTTVLEWDESEPEPLRWLRLADAAGVPAAGPRIDFPVTSAEHGRAAELIGPREGRHLIGLHAGASDPAKRWPPQSFAQLGDRLADRFGARVVLTGSEQERPLTDAVRRMMEAPAIDLAGRTGLGELAAVISALDLLVTNDTGASHIAAATRTPSVVLFGSTRPDRWAPLEQRRHRVVDATACPGAPAEGAAALQALLVDVVFAACRAALGTTDGFARPCAEQEPIACAG